MDKRDLLFVGPFKTRRLRVLKIRGSWRQPVDVKERRVKYPITVGRAVNVCASVFIGPVVIMRIEQVDQRSAIAQAMPSPILEESLEIVYTAIHVYVISTLVRGSGRVFQTRQSVP